LHVEVAVISSTRFFIRHLTDRDKMSVMMQNMFGSLMLWCVSYASTVFAIPPPPYLQMLNFKPGQGESAASGYLGRLRTA
jgi:hypothetical protein